ncbi:MAG: hypothetical protein K2J73_08675 [Oscillospiraceae bacterium]|nr:hypothetical protein [Oscillospiraceae bacterium]
MANPLFKAMGGNQQSTNMLEAFPKFMQQMRGKDPNEILNGLISSGKVSQQQLDMVQRQAQQIQQMPGMFEKFKGMFK